MKFKRILAFFLVLCATLTLLPPQAQATETPQTTLESSNMTVEATNGFGSLLSAEIASRQAEEADSDYQAGYTITDLTFSGSTATVTYDALEEAVLVVAVYTEDGLRMLASGKTTVSPNETQATVSIEGDMPEYFYAGAFLLDSDDYVPLCEDYTTPMYTQEMQELLASTVDDYDASRVYNLDDDKTTNFAVFAENTVVVREQASVNTVVSSDDDARVYVIENADENITSLQQGAILAYPYGDGQILIVKVASVTTDGTTATITGTDLTMEEVFSHVKIEGESDTSDISVDDSSAADYVTYLGLIEDGTARSVEGGPSLGGSHTFEIEKQTYKEESEHLDINAEFGAKFTFELEVSVDFYVSPTQKYLEFEATPKMGLYIDISGKITGKIPIGEFAVSPCAGVYVKFEPKVEIEFNGTLEINVPCSATLGFRYDNVSGVTNISKAPKPDFNFKIQCSIFIGVDFNPKLIILSENVVATKATALAGLEFTVKDDSAIHDDLSPSESRRHSCAVCTKADISFVAKLDGSITFFDSDRLTVKVEIGSWKVPIGKMYYSLTYDKFGFGSCPYITYKTTIVVLDAESNPAKGTVVTMDNDQTETTDENGIAVFYLNDGSHTVGVYFDDTLVFMQIIVDGNSLKETISEAIYTRKPNGIEGSVDSETVADYGIVIESGKCGTNANWTLYSSGMLSITGSGDMSDYSVYYDKVPWLNYRDAILSINISQGITRIGECSFYNCDNLVSVTIADSVMSIGESAFSACVSLESITIPYGVTAISTLAFSGCRNLKSITIPRSVTTIGSSAFSYCKSLESISIPDSVTHIYADAFSNCDSLVSVVIPASVSSIGERAFESCDSLENFTVESDNMYYSSDDAGVLYNKDKTILVQSPGKITGRYTIPQTVTEIGNYAFYNCTNLVGITMPDSITSIGNHGFGSCRGLKEIALSDNLTSIGSAAFYYCDSLEKITIPASVTEIEAVAFNNCIGLTSITFMGDAPDIAYYYSYTFAGVTATCYYPADNPTWTSDVMLHYGGKLTWVPYTLDGSGNMVTNEAAAITATTDGEAIAEETSPVLPASFTDDLVIPEQPPEEMTPDAIYGGEYSTEVTDTYTLKTATFSDLAPGEEYVMLAMVSIETEDSLAADNLLGILQGTAEADGTLVFQYVQRVDTNVSYVVACGPSNKSLADAEITFPEMTADGTLQVVDPTVTYGGKILTEGVDYEITGTVDFTEPGEYTCQIRGIHNYTGVVICTYIVAENPVPLGDVNGDGEINIFDANLIAAYYNEVMELTEEQLAAADVNHDGTVNIFDANLVAAYYNEVIDAFPEE